METTRKQEKKRKEKEKINAFIIYHVIWTIFNQDWWPVELAVNNPRYLEAIHYYLVGHLDR